MTSRIKTFYWRMRSVVLSLSKYADARHRRASFYTFIVRKILKQPIIFPDRNRFQYIIFPEEHIYSLFYNGYLGYPEIAEQEFCKKLLRPGMRVFDIGAHIGQFTLLFASLVGSSGQVYAFEPCDSTMQRLKAHILLNGFNNVVTEQVAAYVIHGSYVNLNTFPQGYSVWNTLGTPTMFRRNRPKQKLEPVGQEVVPTVTIDKYCQHRGIRHIDYFKVDVEGAELDVLKGCSGLLKGGAIRYVQFEVSQAMIQGMGRDGSEVFNFLSDFGYKCHPISGKGDLLPPVETTDAFFANFVAVREYEQPDAGRN